MIAQFFRVSRFDDDDRWQRSRAVHSAAVADRKYAQTPALWQRVNIPQRLVPSPLAVRPVRLAHAAANFSPHCRRRRRHETARVRQAARRRFRFLLRDARHYHNHRTRNPAFPPKCKFNRKLKVSLRKNGSSCV